MRMDPGGLALALGLPVDPFSETPRNLETAQMHNGEFIPRNPPKMVIPGSNMFQPTSISETINIYQHQPGTAFFSCLHLRPFWGLFGAFLGPIAADRGLSGSIEGHRSPNHRSGKWRSKHSLNTWDRTARWQRRQSPWGSHGNFKAFREEYRHHEGIPQNCHFTNLMRKMMISYWTWGVKKLKYPGEHQNGSDAGALIAHKLALRVEITGLLTEWRRIAAYHLKKLAIQPYPAHVWKVMESRSVSKISDLRASKSLREYVAWKGWPYCLEGSVDM